MGGVSVGKCDGVSARKGVTCAVGAVMLCCCPPQVPGMGLSRGVSIGNCDGFIAQGFKLYMQSDPDDDDDVANDALPRR